MYLSKTPKYLYYLKKLLCKCKSNKNIVKQKLISSTEIIPYFSLNGVIKGSAKITKISSLTEYNMCFEYNGQITKFAVRLYGLECLNDTVTNLEDIIPTNKLVYLVAHNFDTDGKLLVTLYNNKHLYNIGDMSINEHILIKNNIDDFIRGVDPFFDIVI